MSLHNIQNVLSKKQWQYKILARLWRNWITPGKLDHCQPGKSLAVFLKRKPTALIQSSDCTHWHLSQRTGNLCSYKNLCMDVWSSLIGNSWKLEMTQMSFNKRMAEIILVHPYHGILLSNEKAWIIDTHINLGEFSESNSEWKAHQSQRAACHMPLFVEESSNGCHGVTEGREGRREEGAAIKGSLRNTWGHPNGLHLDCIQCHILVLMLYYGFARCYHWGKLVKGT